MSATKDIKAELKATIAEINALIEAELNKLMPILGEETTTIIALELDIDPARLRVTRPHVRTIPSGYSEWPAPRGPLRALEAKGITQ